MRSTRTYDNLVTDSGVPSMPLNVRLHGTTTYHHHRLRKFSTHDRDTPSASQYTATMTLLMLEDTMYYFKDISLMWQMGVNRVDWSGEGAEEKGNGLKQCRLFF